MIKNYVITAVRNLLKNKGFTTINVLGLTLGITTCLLIVFYVFDEVSYDQFNLKANRIYRINNEIKFGGNEGSYAVSPAPAAAAFKTDFPEVEAVTRFRERGGYQVRKGKQNIRENAIVYVDPAIFDVFTLPMINGDPKTALKEPYSVVISEKVARKYFNTTSAVGKVLTFNDTSLYKVTGVIKNIPEQSHFHFDFFLSMSTLAESREIAWFSNNFNTYILFRPNTDISAFKTKLPDFIRRHGGPQLSDILHLTFDQLEQSGSYFRFTVIPLNKIHLQSNSQDELEANGNIQTVYIFSAIAILVLLIACVNFMNLSTARSSNRAKEVGIRKVLGSSRKNLIIQFLTESMIVTLFAAVVATIAAYMLLGVFNALSGKQLVLTPQILTRLLPVLGVFIIVIGCVAGAYPAFYLSGFQPIEVLKGKIATGFKRSNLRNVLVVGQFVISIALIIATLVIYTQLKYIENKDIGYNRDHIMTVWDTELLGDKAKIFKQEIKRLADVQDLTMTGYLPTNGANNNSSLFKDPVLDQKRALQSSIWYVDEDYIPTFKMKIITGRNFSNQMGTDSTAIIINESAANQLAFPDPLNQNLYFPVDKMARVMKPFKIIGVIKDFNFKSLRDNVTPMVLFNQEESGPLSIRFKSTDIGAFITQVEKKWVSLSPNQQFNYSFMDQDFEKLYRTEQRTGQIALAFTSLAVIIACLGLFGLTAYAAAQRNKEIGIRKVLGANIPSIVHLLSKDFIGLVLIAIAIALPVAYYFMNKWLEGFAYHQHLQWWILFAAAIGALGITMMTISFQSVKAAIINPVNSLRSE